MIRLGENDKENDNIKNYEEPEYQIKDYKTI